MSTDRAGVPGGKAVAERMVAGAKAELEAQALLEAEAAEAEQLDLLEPLSAEEVAVAQETLGPAAGPLAVIRQAREARRGRPKGSRNRRSDDFEQYISRFGPDPAVVMARFLGDSEEAMVERSRQLDPVKRQLSWGDARAMRIRCAEALMPYRHAKKPVAIDTTIRGVMVVEEFGGGAARGVTIEAEPLGVLPFEDEGGPE